MAFSIPSVLELSLSKYPQKRHNLITILMVVGLVILVLMSLLAVALPAFDGLVEEDKSFLESGILGQLYKLSFAGAVRFSALSGILFGLTRLDYLKGHIGEKRLDDSDFQLNNQSVLFLLHMAVLFFRAVFLFCHPYVFARD